MLIDKQLIYLDYIPVTKLEHLQTAICRTDDAVFVRICTENLKKRLSCITLPDQSIFVMIAGQPTCSRIRAISSIEDILLGKSEISIPLFTDRPTPGTGSTPGSLCGADISTTGLSTPTVPESSKQ